MLHMRLYTVDRRRDSASVLAAAQGDRQQQCARQHMERMLPSRSILQPVPPVKSELALDGLELRDAAGGLVAFSYSTVGTQQSIVLGRGSKAY